MSENKKTTKKQSKEIVKEIVEDIIIDTPELIIEPIVEPVIKSKTLIENIKDIIASNNFEIYSNGKLIATEKDNIIIKNDRIIINTVFYHLTQLKYVIK